MPKLDALNDRILRELSRATGVLQIHDRGKSMMSRRHLLSRLFLGGLFARAVTAVAAPTGPAPPSPAVRSDKLVLTDAQWRQLTESSLRLTPDGRHELCYDPGIGETFRRDAEAFDLWPIYDRIRCPTLVVRGAESDLLTPQTVQAMVARGPRPTVVEVPGVGHAPMFMDEAQIGCVRDFLLAA